VNPEDRHWVSLPNVGISIKLNDVTSHRHLPLRSLPWEVQILPNYVFSNSFFFPLILLLSTYILLHILLNFSLFPFYPFQFILIYGLLPFNLNFSFCFFFYFTFFASWFLFFFFSFLALTTLRLVSQSDKG
jgi:hypothetical protein